MKEAASDCHAAPAWYNQARTVIGGSNPKIHIKDGAFFNMRAAQPPPTPPGQGAPAIASPAPQPADAEFDMDLDDDDW